ncbi:hydrogenase maturation protease [Pseudoxanthobacter sp. M-2]|uniref:hydrogenase maturation protease n=1 Tax=Pseudoxanthobacter sp. M-2 TaxID=3078754 RepID=UPI0038FC6D9C
MLVVIGCGNLVRCDDGVGVVVVQRLLAGDPLPAGVKVFDAGTGGMEILFQARDATRLVVVDACRSGAEPGAVFEVPGSELESRPPPNLTLHDFRWDHALHAGRRIWKDAFPADVTVFLIEAKTLGYGLALSPEVERAAAIVTARIAALIDALRQASAAAQVTGAGR